MAKLHIIGGGLAGCEAAWQAVQSGVQVVLYEMRPARLTPAHQTGQLAELVCSNSLKSLQQDSAPGQLKNEMQGLGSLIIEAGYAARVPAGQALAVDREVFSRYVEDKLSSHPLFTRIDREILELPDVATPGEAWVVATGPLTSDGLAQSLQKLCGGDERLYFYDAIAPIISADSIDESECFFASRYDRDQGDHAEGDYLNIPLSKDEYETFIDAIITAEKTPLHAFESTKYFEACLPIEVMIERGRETLRFGPMKPVGLRDPKTGREPWGVIQLRAENRQRTMFSMVGFQTKMKWPEQKRVFSMLPALRNAEFLRYGSVHRNTYITSPKVVDTNLSFRSAPHIFLAGQITGVEGYTESSAIGLMAGRAAVAALRAETFRAPPPTTVLGSLLSYVTKGGTGAFQPMNSNFGLLPPAPFGGRKLGKQLRRQEQCRVAREDFARYLQELDTKF